MRQKSSLMIDVKAVHNILLLFAFQTIRSKMLHFCSNVSRLRCLSQRWQFPWQQSLWPFISFLAQYLAQVIQGDYCLWLWILKDCLESLWLFGPRCVLEKLLEEWNVCFVHPCFLSIQLRVPVKSTESGMLLSRPWVVSPVLLF